jgi:hypothetical protein
MPFGEALRGLDAQESPRLCGAMAWPLRSLDQPFFSPRSPRFTGFMAATWRFFSIFAFFASLRELMLDTIDADQTKLAL